MACPQLLYHYSYIFSYDIARSSYGLLQPKINQMLGKSIMNLEYCFKTRNCQFFLAGKKGYLSVKPKDKAEK
jgi:hypothetical protein